MGPTRRFQPTVLIVNRASFTLAPGTSIVIKYRIPQGYGRPWKVEYRWEYVGPSGLHPWQTMRLPASAPHDAQYCEASVRYPDYWARPRQRLTH